MILSGGRATHRDVDDSVRRWGLEAMGSCCWVFFFQAEDGIRDDLVTGVQTCALPISADTSKNDLTLDDQGPPDGPFTSAGETDKSSDDLSDNASGLSIGGGASMLILKDPVTGVMTNILSGQQGVANFDDQAGDDVSNTDTSGMGPGDVVTGAEEDRLAASAGESTQGPLDISIVGSPAPGITADFEAMLITSSTNGAQVQGEDDSQAAGSDTGDVKFSTTDLGTVGGKVNTTVTDVINTDDGHGNTANSSNTLTDNSTVAGMAGDGDRGEDDFTDANGQPTSDNESDTDVKMGDSQQSDKINDQAQANMTTVDSVTGMITKFVL